MKSARASHSVDEPRTYRNSKVPIAPETFTVVQNHTLTKVVGRIPDELDTPPERFTVRDGFFVHVQDPVVYTERDVVSEVVERSGLVFRFACTRKSGSAGEKKRRRPSDGKDIPRGDL
jgi:hypothetical protein